MELLVGLVGPQIAVPPPCGVWWKSAYKRAGEKGRQAPQGSWQRRLYEEAEATPELHSPKEDANLPFLISAPTSIRGALK